MHLHACEVICVQGYSRLFIPSVVCDGKRLEQPKYPSLGELINFDASAVVESHAISKQEETMYSHLPTFVCVAYLCTGAQESYSGHCLWGEELGDLEAGDGRTPHEY